LFVALEACTLASGLLFTKLERRFDLNAEGVTKLQAGCVETQSIDSLQLTKREREN